jgi:segregation and condensation protein B
MVQPNLDNIIIALLFASDEPLSLKKISTVLDDHPVDGIGEAIGRIGERFSGEDSVMLLEQVAGGYQLCTSAVYSDYIARLYRGRRKQRLSKAAMETLAIIAYKQPVTRADIENLRGVGCGGVITTLMERSLIRITGKAKVLGSPFLYGTTQEFLEYLGLNSLKDLPSMEDLEVLLEREAAGENGFELMPSVPAPGGDASNTHGADETDGAPGVDPVEESGSPQVDEEDDDATAPPRDVTESMDTSIPQEDSEGAPQVDDWKKD